jgi:hypothetical protein
VKPGKEAGFNRYLVKPGRRLLRESVGHPAADVTEARNVPTLFHRCYDGVRSLSVLVPGANR